ncbi:MAG TPA: PAS domain-containing protein [Armatimonadota bacterium]
MLLGLEWAGAAGLLLGAYWLGTRRAGAAARRPASAASELEAVVPRDQLLRAAIDGLPYAIYAKDTQGRIVLGNNATFSQYGMPEQQVIGMTDFDLGSKDAEHYRQQEQEILTTGLALAEELVASKDEDGTPKFMVVSKHPVRGPDGRIVGLVGANRDVTDLMLAQQALEEQHRLLRSLVDALPQEVYVKDLDGHFLMVNLASAKGLGLAAPEDAVGRTDFDCLPLDMAERYRLEDRQVMETGEPLLRRSEFVVTPQGDRGWWSSHRVPLRDNEGRVIGLVGIGWDASELELTAEALARRERYLSAIVDIQQHLLTAMPEGEMYQKVLEVLGTATGASRAYVYLPTQDVAGRGIGSRFVTWTEPRRADDANPMGAGLPEDVLLRWMRETGHQTCIARAAQDFPEPDREVLSERGILSALVIPLVVGGRVEGLIGFDYCSRPRVPEPAETDLLRSAAASLGVALERLRAVNHLKRVVGRALCRLWYARVKQADDGTYLWSIQEADSAASQRFLTLEVPPGSSYHDAWQRSIHPADSERVGRQEEDALSRGVAEFTSEFRCVRADGDIRWIQEHVTLQSVGPGQWDVVGVCIDATELERAKAAILEQRNLLRAVIDALPEEVFVKDIKGRFVIANEAVVRARGAASSDDLIGKTDFDLFDRERAEIYWQEEQLILGSGTPAIKREDSVRDSKGGHWWVVTKIPLRDAEGNVVGLVGINEGITERKRAEEERLSLEAQVRHAQKLESLGVLAGGIAHDFNNLLMGVLANASLALSQVAADSPLRVRLRAIETAGQRAAELTNQMLAYSGRGRFVSERLDLSEIAREMVHLMGAAIPKKAELRLRLVEGLPPVEVDVAQVRQVAMNLITNASEALPEEGGVVELRTGLCYVDDAYLATTVPGTNALPGEYVYLEVEDTGCGMDEATLSRLFDPFFTTKFTGRGLGMAAVLGIVRGHEGAIRVTTEVGRGTTFTMLLPRSQSEDVGTASVPRGADREWLAQGVVLVVDDEDYVRDVVCEMLSASGFTPIPAADGMEGVEAFRQHAKDVVAVLLDMEMPRLGGFGALQQIKRIRPDVPVLLCSGYSEEEATRQFAGYGLAGFLQKPYGHESLRGALRQALAGRGDAS